MLLKTMMIYALAVVCNCIGNVNWRRAVCGIIIVGPFLHFRRVLSSGIAYYSAVPVRTIIARVLLHAQPQLLIVIVGGLFTILCLIFHCR